MTEQELLRDDWAVRCEYAGKDRRHWECLEATVAAAGLPWSALWSNFPAFARRRELAILLARYELFKKIVDVPGSIAEVGVYLGAGLFTWSSLLETFCPGDRSRRVYGFDHCQGYMEFTAGDGQSKAWADRCIGEKSTSESYIKAMVELHNRDNFLPGIERCSMIVGDVVETVPEFAKQALGTRLCMLHLDVNLHEPTLVALQSLYPLVLRGGIVILNGYGGPPWCGEAKATEEYFAAIGESPAMRKFPFSLVPGAYFVKGELR